MTSGRFGGWSELDKCARTVLRNPGGSAIIDSRESPDQNHQINLFPCLLAWCAFHHNTISVQLTPCKTKIEHLGTVSSIVVDVGGCSLTISNSAEILDDCHIGDSIAVNGACLTVTEFNQVENGGWFKVWLANETLDRTDLGVLLIILFTWPLIYLEDRSKKS